MSTCQRGTWSLSWTARESYISGRRSLAELTATSRSCISLWEGAFALADVSGTGLLDRRSMALLARSAALRGDAVFLIRDDGLVPCSDWDLRTRNGKPSAYRVSISEAGGGTTQTALAGGIGDFADQFTDVLERDDLPEDALGCMVSELEGYLENLRLVRADLQALKAKHLIMPEEPADDSDQAAYEAWERAANEAEKNPRYRPVVIDCVR